MWKTTGNHSGRPSARSAAGGNKEHGEVTTNKEGSEVEDGEDGGKRKGFC